MRIALTVLIASLLFHAAAQPAFISRGTITFERKINSYAILPGFLKEAWKMDENEIAPRIQRMKEYMKQFHTDNFELNFDNSKSLYQYVEKEDEKDSYTPFFMRLADKNKVYNNFSTGEGITEKQVYEKLFFIKDSLKHIDWKITEEIREIAGYPCRRANALVDSIYVVAFYSDEILTPGGPESFHGLPGMILGVALPHLHITIFAKSVKALESAPEKLKIPKPGKKTTPLTNKELMEALSKKLGEYSALQSAWGRKFIKI